MVISHCTQVCILGSYTNECDNLFAFADLDPILPLPTLFEEEPADNEEDIG